jgi:hypothetical protein
MKGIFFGSKVEVLKLLSAQSNLINGGAGAIHRSSEEQSPVSPLIKLSKQKEIFSTRKEKLGPINLDIKTS